jgi:hypothetical protein
MAKASDLQAIKQNPFSKRLAQESDCSRGQRLGTRRLVGTPCDEDRWHHEAIGAEMLIKL